MSWIKLNTQIIICFFAFICFFSFSKDSCFHDDRHFRCVQYIRNHDGDTVTVNIPGVHSLIGKKIRVRVRGVDTPELNSKNECERKVGESARLFTAQFMKKAKRIDLINIQRGNYFRIVADIQADGRSLGENLLNANLASRFGKKVDWCQSKKALKILILGDSLTSGYGLDPTQAFPHQLEILLNHQFKNYKTQVVADGINGATSAGAESRLKKYSREKPDIVVIALGGNDGLRGLPVRSIKSHLQKAIDWAVLNKVKVVLAGMKIPINYGQQYRKSFEKVYEDLVEDNQLVFIPFILKGVGLRPELNLPDRIHPNSYGHKVIAQNILPHLKGFYK